jgi:hypothetical protein
LPEKQNIRRRLGKNGYNTLVSIADNSKLAYINFIFFWTLLAEVRNVENKSLNCPDVMVSVT